MRRPSDETARSAAERARLAQDRADELVFKAKEAERSSHDRVKRSRRTMRISVKRWLA
jgi:hypothetical protein